MEQKEYHNGTFTIIWQPGKCTHSGICAKTLPDVYRPKEKPWIQPLNASAAALQAQIDRCPSGALSYRIDQTDQS